MICKILLCGLNYDCISLIIAQLSQLSSSRLRTEYRPVLSMVCFCKIKQRRHWKRLACLPACLSRTTTLPSRAYRLAHCSVDDRSLVRQMLHVPPEFKLLHWSRYFLHNSIAVEKKSCWLIPEHVPCFDHSCSQKSCADPSQLGQYSFNALAKSLISL